MCSLGASGRIVFLIVLTVLPAYSGWSFLNSKTDLGCGVCHDIYSAISQPTALDELNSPARVAKARVCKLKPSRLWICFFWTVRTAGKSLLTDRKWDTFQMAHSGRVGHHAAHLDSQGGAVQLMPGDEEFETRHCFVARPYLRTSKQNYQHKKSRNPHGVDWFPFSFRIWGSFRRWHLFKRQGCIDFSVVFLKQQCSDLF